MKQTKSNAANILASIINGSRQEDQIDSLTNKHFEKAITYYAQFEELFAKTVANDLKETYNMLNKQLNRATRKLDSKLRGPYNKQLGDSITSFYLDDFISKEIDSVYKALANLKSKIFQYINEFCNNIISRNLQKNRQLSLYHFSNEIKSLDKNWNSVSSRSPVNRAEIQVNGFFRPQTTWLALGVTKRMKEFGPIKTTFNKEDFMGNIYLNGSDEMSGDYRLKRDLNNLDIFVIECQNRMVWVYRKSEGKNKKETFIMDDNVDYYIYIGIRGPIQLKFQAE